MQYVAGCSLKRYHLLFLCSFTVSTSSCNENHTVMSVMPYFFNIVFIELGVIMIYNCGINSKFRSIFYLYCVQDLSVLQCHVADHFYVIKVTMKQK